MGVKSKGRGTAAAFGLLLLFAGLVGGAVLYISSELRPGQAVDDFARAPVGCTTTLDFTETGTFYVYEEFGGEVVPADGTCEPAADAAAFGFDVRGAGADLVPITDDSVTYSRDERIGQSVARIEVGTPGGYEIVVAGDDVSVVAAIGRDPNDGVDELRRGALLVGAAGMLLGLLLLVLAGWRSKRAATYAAPSGPGWGPQRSEESAEWPPESPQLERTPLSPQEEPAVAAPPPPPLPARQPSTPPVSPWGPPPADTPPADGPDPAAQPTTTSLPPLPTPTLPDTPRRPSSD